MFWQGLSDGADDRTFLIADGRRYSYNDVFGLGDALFSKADRAIVLILCDRSPETVAAYLGALRKGLVPMFSRGRDFALDDELSVDIDRVQAFAESNRDNRIFIFGFTSIVWLNFVQMLRRQNVRLNLSNSFLLHGGGWKKLADQKISDAMFKDEVREWTGCSDIRNYYGMNPNVLTPV